MVVDIVGDGAAVRNHDVRRNEPPTETAGDQIAVLHARPADTGISIGSPGDHELRDEIRDEERSWFDRDDGSLRCGGVEPDQPVGAVEIGDPGASAGEMVTSRYPRPRTARSLRRDRRPGSPPVRLPRLRPLALLDVGPLVAQADRAMEHRRHRRRIVVEIAGEVAESLELHDVARCDIGDGRLGLRRFIVFAPGLSDAKGSSPSAPGCGSVKRRS